MNHWLEKRRDKYTGNPLFCCPDCERGMLIYSDGLRCVFDPTVLHKREEEVLQELRILFPGMVK